MEILNFRLRFCLQKKGVDSEDLVVTVVMHHAKKVTCKRMKSTITQKEEARSTHLDPDQQTRGLFGPVAPNAPAAAQPYNCCRVVKH